MKKLLPPLLMLALAGACDVAGAAPARSPAVGAALKTMSGAGLLGHISALASDDFEGRAPGTKGESMTLEYLQTQFKRIGLAPGNPDGTYLQKVPLLGVRSTPTLRFSTGARSVDLDFPADYVAWSTRTEARVTVPESELVFVGYGVTAPVYRWDDYKGVDLRGKTLLMLVNDPPAFGADAMTYDGRGSKQFDMAAKLGAAGALIVHETKAGSSAYEAVRNSWSRENFSLQSEGPNPHFPALAGWLQLDRAKDAMRSVGYDFDKLKAAAQSRDFKPVALGVTSIAHIDNQWREVASHNVVAKIEGADPRLKDEYVIYSAHWDHFGIDESLPGSRTQQIYHGALDNASGVAALLELAKAYKALRVAPKRSILFVLTTGEERGLLGAQHYVRHPLYPLSKTLIDINVDAMNLWGRSKVVQLAGVGTSGADRSEFARAGVPVVYLGGARATPDPRASSGNRSSKRRGREASLAAVSAQARFDQYLAHDYHKVSDVVQPGWDMRGALEDLTLLFHAGYDTAQGKPYSQWKPGAESKAARNAR